MRLAEIGSKHDGTKVYAKSNCKKCNGRGFVGFSRPVKNSGIKVPIGPIVCWCVFAIPGQQETEKSS